MAEAPPLIIVAPTVPVPDAYDPASVSMDGWLQVFSEFCRLSNILAEPAEPPAGQPNPVNNRRSWFLKCIGQRNFEILRMASLPLLPNERSIPFHVQRLKERFESPQLVPVMRMEFNGRTQKPNESIHEYIASLQDLASKCNFGNNLNEMLRDQLVRGIRSDECRRKLLAEVDLEFANAKNIAIQDESIRRQSQALANAVHVGRVNSQPKPRAKKPQNPNSSPTTSRQSSSNQRRGQGQSTSQGQRQSPSQGQRPKFGPCRRCGRKHNCHTCPARNWKCFKCNLMGHTSKYCPSDRVNSVGTEEPKQESQSGPQTELIEQEVQNVFKLRSFC
ncbi:uncharacterized protein LOC117642911 [Thrips palmi]|uniref:Uncharacterized protein LOC117642911 n=1 Tax=Thrips palmi TaxID=161013 RepID=A0A6P8YK84_THRPL|nr:uncharacterized protein LOC117642911 [Thrips palmi]